MGSATEAVSKGRKLATLPLGSELRKIFEELNVLNKYKNSQHKHAFKINENNNQNLQQVKELHHNSKCPIGQKLF